MGLRDLAGTTAKWVEIAAVTQLYLIPAIGLSVLDPALSYRLLHRWGRSVLRRWGVTLEVIDAEGERFRSGPTVFLQLNQSSLLEAAVWTSVFPHRVGRVLNLEFALIPIAGWALAAADAFVVVRQWPRQAKARIIDAARYVKRGGQLIISVEGRRSRDGSLSPFKNGPIVLACTAGAAIVPVTLGGVRERWPHGSWHVTPGPVQVTFHRRLEMSHQALVDRQAILASLREIAIDAAYRREEEQR